MKNAILTWSVPADSQIQVSLYELDTMEMVSSNDSGLFVSPVLADVMFDRIHVRLTEAGYKMISDRYDKDFIQHIYAMYPNPV